MLQKKWRNFKIASLQGVALNVLYLTASPDCRVFVFDKCTTGAFKYSEVMVKCCFCREHNELRSEGNASSTAQGREGAESSRWWDQATDWTVGHRSVLIGHLASIWSGPLPTLGIFFFFFFLLWPVSITDWTHFVEAMTCTDQARELSNFHNF